MNENIHLTTLHGVTMTKDSALRQLQTQLADERKRADMLEGRLAAVEAVHAPVQPVQDATATLRDNARASAHALRDRLRAEQRAQYDGSTERGARARALSDAWQTKPQQSSR